MFCTGWFPTLTLFSLESSDPLDSAEDPTVFIYTEKSPQHDVVGTFKMASSWQKLCLKRTRTRTVVWMLWLREKELWAKLSTTEFYLKIGRLFSRFHFERDCLVLGGGEGRVPTVPHNWTSWLCFSCSNTNHSLDYTKTLVSASVLRQQWSPGVIYHVQSQAKAATPSSTHTGYRN